MDVDGKIPNLALMKISRYYKNLGYSVDLHKVRLDYYVKNNFKFKDKNQILVNTSGYSKVFVSTLYPINKDRILLYGCFDVKKGGVGESLSLNLPDKIENIGNPDYSLYPQFDYGLGFITRGCIRNCYFCIVPEKEGMIRFNMHPRDIIENSPYKKVKFLDNNILAYHGHMDILNWLVENKVKCSFVSGFDIRLINNENAKAISKLRYIGDYCFAFDDYKLLDTVNEKLRVLKKYITYSWDIKFFLYCSPNMELFEVIERVKWCKENKVLPYFMRDKTCWNSEYNKFYVDLTSWCNQPWLFKKLNFEQFLNKRHKNKERIENSLKLWKENEVLEP